MGCLFALGAAFFPRIMFLILWIARPVYVDAVFDTWIWPLLGIIFLPFTTLMYVILWSPGIGLTAWDWTWLILAVVCDVMHYTSTAYYNRERLPGASTPSTTQPM